MISFSFLISPYRNSLHNNNDNINNRFMSRYINGIIFFLSFERVRQTILRYPQNIIRFSIRTITWWFLLSCKSNKIRSFIWLISSSFFCLLDLFLLAIFVRNTYKLNKWLNVFCLLWSVKYCVLIESNATEHCISHLSRHFSIFIFPIYMQNSDD